MRENRVPPTTPATSNDLHGGNGSSPDGSIAIRFYESASLGERSTSLFQCFTHGSPDGHNGTQALSRFLSPRRFGYSTFVCPVRYSCKRDGHTSLFRPYHSSLPSAIRFHGSETRLMWGRWDWGFGFPQTTTFLLKSGVVHLQHRRDHHHSIGARRISDRCPTWGWGSHCPWKSLWLCSMLGLGHHL
jgi:hypothetical protein